MKLVQINEVFEKPSLDGVDITSSGRSVAYRFADEHDQYKVEIFSFPYKRFKIDARHMEILDDYAEGYTNPNTGQPSQIATIYMIVDSKDAIENDKEFEETGHGNQWFVYGKLIACVQHYIQEYKPLILSFSGATGGMDLVYDKFIRMSQKLYPDDAYVPYVMNSFIRKEIADEIGKDETFKAAETKHQQKLKSARHEKQMMRGNRQFRAGNTRTT